MAKKSNPQSAPISADLLEILRDPQAIQEGDRYGSDPGRLELVRDYWLVSADTGYKYPIRDGIPVMLVEEGARWKDTPVDALPVPPPTPAPTPEVEVRSRGVSTTPQRTNYQILVALGALAMLLLVLVSLSRRRSAVAELPSEPVVP